jgi:hypothetical protein
VSGAQDPGTGQATPTTPTTQTTPPAPTPHAVSLVAKLRIKPRGGAFVGTGRVEGKPFGKGRMTTRSTVKSRSPLRISTTLTVRYEEGKVVLKGTGRYVGSTYKATMKVSSGTGDYRRITGSNLKVTSRNKAGVETLRVKGTVRYAEPSQP